MCEKWSGKEPSIQSLMPLVSRQHNQQTIQHNRHKHNQYNPHIKQPTIQHKQLAMHKLLKTTPNPFLLICLLLKFCNRYLENWLDALVLEIIKQLSFLVSIREASKKWHFLDSVLNKGGGPGVLNFPKCVFFALKKQPFRFKVKTIPRCTEEGGGVNNWQIIPKKTFLFSFPKWGI